MTVKYCQQWTVEKGAFVATVWALTRLNLRVLLAWMARESGGEQNHPNGAAFNFLQIKGEDHYGGSVNGFKAYRNVYDAARDAANNIKARQVIANSAGKGPAAQMDAIARAWPHGPGQAAAKPQQPYRSVLQRRFDCIDPKEIRQEWENAGGYDKGLAIGNRLSDLGQPGILDKVGAALDERTSALIDAAWPILLKTALAGTGLALIGYGIVKATGSGSAAETVKQVAPTAAGTARAARGAA